MRIDNLGFKTLSEWLEIFPPRTDITIKIFGQTRFWRYQELLLETLPPAVLRSYVCNLEDGFVDGLRLDVACYELEPFNDEKDEIITDLWEKLYLNADNAERMKLVFDDYKEEYER